MAADGRQKDRRRCAASPLRRIEMQRPKYHPRKNETSAKASAGTARLLLQHIAVPLSLLTALLYLFGHVYNDSYLKYWGLSSDLFPISKEQSIISGFFRSLLLGAEALSKFGYVIAVLFIIVILAFLSMYRPISELLYEMATPNKNKIKSFLKKYFLKNMWVDGFVETVSIIYSTWALTLIIMLIIAISCLLIEKEATRQAIEEKKQILEGKSSNSYSLNKNLVFLENKTKKYDVYSGHLIRASSMYCALYDKKDVQVFAVKDIHQMTIHPKEVAVKPQPAVRKAPKGAAP